MEELLDNKEDKPQHLPALTHLPQTDEEWSSAIEAVLFAAEKPIGIVRLQEIFGEDNLSPGKANEFIENLKQKYSSPLNGFEIRSAQNGYHFVTKAVNAEYIRRYQASKPFKLGRSSLEVLAIIAYRQPITRAEIDQVRGIESSHILRTLIERGLVKMVGKAEVPGRPVQYGTTPKFLETLGLANTEQLPPLSELEQIQGHTDDPMQKLEDGLSRFVEESMDVAGHRELQTQATEELATIESLLDGASAADKEVYASALHAEIGEENILAVTSYQEFSKPKRKKKGETAEEVQAIAETTAVTNEQTPEIPPVLAETAEETPPLVDTPDQA